MRSFRPLGQITRGKTALNRLRQVDVYVALAWPHILTHGTSLIVDLGYGAYPWTALEMFERWRPLNPSMCLLGIEIDPERVATALPYAQPGVIDFRLGGFNLTETLKGERVRLIRAYNVLRQYDETAVSDALHTMSAALEPGGLLIEGTSNPSGRLTVFDVYQKDGDSLTHREIVFATNLRESVEPVDFQAVLPKRLIHHAQDAEPGDFLEVWRVSLTLARGAGYISPRRRWVYAGHLLRERYGYPVDVRSRVINRGYLAVRSTLR